MASLKYHKDAKRWRVFWHITLPNGEVEKGSKSFKEKREGLKFKQYIEGKEKQLKNATIIEVPYFDELVSEWKKYLVSRYTVDTKILYEGCMDDFVDYTEGKVTLCSDITVNVVNDYINYSIGRGLANRTINNSLSVIKNICDYAHQNYAVPNEVKSIKKLKEDPANVKFIELGEYRLIVENADPFSVAWLKFIANTGLRASEFINLKWLNYNASRKTITVVGKGRKRRTIGLNKTAVEVLENAKNGKKVKTNDYMFKRKDGEKLSRHTLYNYVEKACIVSGLEKRGPHILRHFFATQLLLKGVPIIKVSKLMGHASVTTTEKCYAHILSDDISGVTGVLDGL